MAAPSVARSPPTWDEIERSESYLVCCMFDEAASLSSSVLSNLCDNVCIEKILDDVEFNDMMESAGMVLVQSLKELGRTSEILSELNRLFGSVAAIPFEVFLTGVCFQMHADPSGVREFFEKFLGNWRCMDDQCYVLAGQEANLTNIEGCTSEFVLGVEKYLQIVELYAVTFLMEILNDMDLAISWVEKAALPEQKRQELLRRLHSMHSSKVASHFQASTSNVVEDENPTHSSTPTELTLYEVSSKTRRVYNGKNDTKQSILKLYGRKVPGFWWFRTINLKFGSHRLAFTNGNVLLGFLLLLLYFFMRTKKDSIKRIIKKQALFVKKAVVDLWQLAFSYQVNPLAAVEPLPSVIRGNQR